MSTEQPAPPYPADVRARGWRFELDHERMRQSDTWALASPDVRPWLLMLWLVAWEQVPCGSLPADDALICARIGMALRVFGKVREVLMRGWWLASDGRLYHAVIAERVVSMLDAKRKESDRKAAYRMKMEAERAALSRKVPDESSNVPRDNHGTDAGQPRDGRGCDATGTGTGTGTRRREEEKEQKTTDAIASAASAKPPRAVRKCPGSFDLTPELLEFAAKFPAVDCRAETEKLRDHTFKNAISDWPGTWRNWIRRAADGAQQTRASPMSFAERDELAAIARVHEMTGGLVSAKPFTPRRPDALQEVFDARTAARKMDHVAVRPDASALRLGLVEQVEGG